MRVSVITASFNSSSTLKATLDSFRSQNYQDKELIVIDGCSTDGSLEIIKASGNNVSRWVSEPDSGIYDALNKGINMATGDIIGFLHSGDTYAGTEILEKLAFHFIQDRADAVYGDLRYVNSEKRENIVRYWKSGVFYPGILSKGWMPPHPTLYMRREVYRQHGLFDLGFTIAADYDLMLRVLLQPGIRINYIPEVLIDMETGGLSNGSLGNIARKSLEDLRAIRKNGMKNSLWVLARKNLSKLGQFFGDK